MIILLKILIIYVISLLVILGIAWVGMAVICLKDGINWFDYNPDKYDYSKTRLYKNK